MKQVVQRLSDGRVEVVEVPIPQASPETALVRVRASLVSTGTERTKLETGRQTLLAKARARPDEVRKVLDKAKQEGVRDTVRAVRARLEQPAPLGYSSAGTVIRVGERVPGLAPGDRVACGGGEFAVHAEVDRVPGNLCIPLPARVGFEQGAFATVGSIALHAVRQAEAQIGERVAVVGLGLVGQLCAQILAAAGCGVVGIDVAPELVQRALSIGSVAAAYPRDDLDDDALPPDAAACDAVVVAAATPSSDPLHLAARLCRDRGRVVVVGDVGMDVPRRLYYEKELELRLSRSSGPGRYDRAYEERGLDYPIAYVRWTERRNMGAFLDLVAAGKVQVEPLVTDRVPIEQAPEAYDRLLAADTSPLAIMIEYSSEPEAAREVVPRPAGARTGDPLTAGVIGAGSFATRILIPSLRAASFRLGSIASATGLSARAAADRFGFARVETPDELVEDPELGLVAIATRHDSHATLAARALRAGKHVYVEKPPCLTVAELHDLEAARNDSQGVLAVGFNRRYAPLAVEARKFVRAAGAPLALLYRVSPERLPVDHWMNDPDEGGGRLLAEGCHFVDFACWLVGGAAEHVSSTVRPEAGRPLAAAATFSITLDFADGSLATIAYLAEGAREVRKEYVEVHAGERSAVIDDFRSLVLLAGGRTERRRVRRADKGHARQFAALRAQLESEDRPLEPDPLASMGVALAALQAARDGSRVRVADVVGRGIG
jgi:predicted dehydrogenase